MSTAQHTPGPWSFAHRETKAGMFSTEVFCADGHTIASLAWYPMPTVDGVTGTYRNENARLIAAAPELLAALQMAVRQNSHDMQLTGEELRQCEAALAKATQSADDQTHE